MYNQHMITKAELKTLLKKQILNIKFKKINGTERLMCCSLKTDLLPVQETNNELKENKQNRKENEEVLSVWDLEKKAFRSFRINSIIDYCSVDEGYEL